MAEITQEIIENFSLKELIQKEFLMEADISMTLSA